MTLRNAFADLSTEETQLLVKAALETIVAQGGAGILAVRHDDDTVPVADGQPHPLYTNGLGRLKVATMPGAYSAAVGDIVAVGGTVVADVARASNVMMYCTGTFAAVNCTFEGSIDDGLNWFGVQAVRSNANTVELSTGALSAAPLYAWEMSVNALTHVRVRCSARTSGTQSWRILPGAYATEPIPAMQTHAVTTTGTVVATPATGSTYSVSTAATTNTAVVKSSAGAIYEMTISNTSAAAVYVKLYNQVAAPSLATAVPVLTLPVAAGSTVIVPFASLGKRFGTGIAIAATGGAADTDATAAPVGVKIHATYV